MAPIIVDLMTFLDDFMVFLEASEAFSNFEGYGYCQQLHGRSHR
jgi:hypothetical protein